MKNKTFITILSLALVVIGIGLIGNVFEVWNFKVFFPGWWTLFIIIPAVIKLIKNGVRPVYVIWLSAGVLLLVLSLDIIPDIVGELIMPVLILALGFTIFFRARLGSGDGYIAIFSGRTPNFVGKPFGGAFAIAVFGGVDLKLREAVIESDVTIDAIAIFGGVDIVVPIDGVNVEVSGVPLFGGVGEPKNRPYFEGAPTIHVNAFALFGGVDVK